MVWLASWGKSYVVGGAEIWGDRRGITAVEYAIIAGIMVVALVVSVPLIGPSLSGIFNHVSSEL